MNRIKKILAILLASLLLTSCVSQKSGKKANNGELRIAATSMATVYICLLYTSPSPRDCS